MMRKTSRTVLILLTIGTFVSARQIPSRAAGTDTANVAGALNVESVFTAADGALDLQEMAASLQLVPDSGMRSAHADTLETYDIQLEDEQGSGINAKTIAALVVIGLFIGITIYVLIGDSDEDPVDDDGGGKPFPGYRGFAIPIP